MPYKDKDYGKARRKIYNKEYRKKNKEKIKAERVLNAEKYSTYMKGYRRLLKSRFKQWEKHARLRGIEFNITLEYLESFPLVCAYTNQELTLEANKFNTVSLDRIDSSIGYIEENVAFCCWKVNIGKNDLSVADFINMCRDVYKNFKSKGAVFK